jgi:hypothetical protein
MSEPRVRIRAGWKDSGKEGNLLAGPICDRKGQDWMCVQWDVDEDPDLHKCAGLEVSSVEWRPVKP